MRMAGELIELEELREATRARLSPEALAAVRDLAETYEIMGGDATDKLTAEGLSVLLAMHDKLEALRHGH